MSPHRVLVLSATASAINVINALRDEPDLELFVTDASSYASGLYERGVTPIVVPRAQNSDAYRTSIDTIIREQGIGILLPTSDHDVTGIIRLLAQGWNPPVALFRPDAAVHGLMIDKFAIARSLRAAALPAPETWRLPQEARFPAVVKPASEGGSKGVAIVRSSAEAATAYAQVVAQYGPNALIQEFVPGELGSTYVSLMLYGTDGELVLNTTMRSSLSYYTWGGGGNAGYLVDEPEIAKLSPRIVAEAGGWRGPLNIEFRRNAETGEFMVIEINCRLNGYSYLTTMNGLNYPRAMIDLLLAAPPRPIGTPAANRRNFVLGFRERLVSRWVENSPRKEELA